MNPTPSPKPTVAPRDAEVTLADAESARQAVAQLLASNQATRLLIDATAVQSLPKPSHLFVSANWLAHILPRAARVALVVRPGQVSHARLIERVARNAGAFLTYFTDRQKARCWVRGPASPRHTLSSAASACPPAASTATTKEPYAV